jgi:hypothetical protein
LAAISLACGCARDSLQSPIDIAPWSSASPGYLESDLQYPFYLTDSASAPDAARFAATGQFLYGPLAGYAQTPAGGSPGSSSRKRPRFSELGIYTAAIGAAELSGSFGRHEFFGDAEIIRPGGNNTLRAPLETHAQSFPAGTGVSSDIALDSYRIGYRYHLFALDNPRPRFDLAPYLDLDLWNFDYRISGAGHSTSRGYLKPTVQLGISANWTPAASPFSLTGDFATSPPGISSLPWIASEQLAVRYRFPATARLSVTATAGVRFEQYNFQDEQRISNHIHATLGPMLLLGLGVEF